MITFPVSQVFAILTVLPSTLTFLDLVDFHPSPSHLAAFLKAAVCPLLRRVRYNVGPIPENEDRYRDFLGGGSERGGAGARWRRWGSTNSVWSWGLRPSRGGSGGAA